ncbi:MAG: carbon-nitrogen hydrolase family protein [Anaerolineales bacterium]|nr:carbon-nitrogen hydrolase family protein [Anaerolineales bacterium]
MDAAPAPTAERLKRAEALVEQAARVGAQLVVLPELFNTGYAYQDENFQRAETLDGPTVAWMKATSSRLNLHLAGSLMLWDGSDIYNSLLLIAPDGRIWRYDKNYPWGWERGYFRGSRQISIAHTELGDIGMMLCWDIAHASRWRRYAGSVDFLLVCSCPPDVSMPTYHFPDGQMLTLDDLGLPGGWIKGSAGRVFQENFSQQTAWLRAPAVLSSGCGRFRTPIPRGRILTLALLPVAPWLGRFLSQADGLELSCNSASGCKILDARGEQLAGRTPEEGEGFVVAEVTVGGRKSTPIKTQPTPPVPLISYLLSDYLLPWLSLPVYREGVHRAQGVQHPAYCANERKSFVRMLFLVAGIFSFIWLFLRRRK